MKVIAILGEPGSGKTTLMNRLLKHLKPTPYYDRVKLVPYMATDNNIFILGKYEEGEVFGGTDKMSMAVQPEAIKFLDYLNKNDDGREPIVLFEGDRLCTATFLENCVDKYDTSIVYLKTHRETREERFKERGSNQNKTWLTGRETKVSNILTNFDLIFFIESMINDTIEQQTKIYDYIINLMDIK